MINDFIYTLKERGFISQITDENGLSDHLSESRSIYVGFDLTADDLHIGSLVQIMMLKWAALCGHKPVVVLGSATTKIGDPSGKDESRKMLSEDDIRHNKNGIRRTFTKLFGHAKYLMIDNNEWFAGFKFIDYLRDFGTHFTINKMLTMDSVKGRLERENPMTFLEFNYMIMQSVDFMELNNRYGVTLQMGGNDQWGNIVNGIDLTRRLNEQMVYGLTTPLLTTASGEKMGKSVANGTIWLNAPDMAYKNGTSVFDFWQYWRNVDDRDVERFLKLFTFQSLDTIKKLVNVEGAEINKAKIFLADVVTEFVHGIDAAMKAKAEAEALFVSKTVDDVTTFKSIRAMPVDVVDILTETGLATSKRDAVRLIQGKGVYMNDATVEEVGTRVTASDLVDGKVKIAKGKKNIVVVEFE